MVIQSPLKRALAPILALLCVSLLYSQSSTQIDLKIQATDADFSAFSLFRTPMGSSLPATCAQGQSFFLTTAANGQNIYGCVATNTWAVEGGGGGGGSMTWPGAAGIAVYAGSSTWGTSLAPSGTGLFVRSSSGAWTVGGIQASDVPNPLNQSTTGNAATATALAGSPTTCSVGSAPTGILPSGNATGCAAYDVSGAAASAITTAEAYSSNASNLTSGTVAAARLPAALASSTSVNGTTIPASSTLPSTGTLVSGNFVKATGAGALADSGLALTGSAVTGISDTQVLTNKTISGSSNTLSNIGNGSLTNSYANVNGVTCTLGAACNVPTPVVCASSTASSSSTAYTCSTTPSFTPATGTAILWEPGANDASNSTATPTLAVNGAAASTITKQAGNSAVAIGDVGLVATGAQYIALYDGANWEIASQTATAGSGSGTVNNSSTAGLLAYYASTGTAVSSTPAASYASGTLTAGASGTNGALQVKQTSGATVGSLQPLVGTPASGALYLGANAAGPSSSNYSMLFNGSNLIISSSGSVILASNGSTRWLFNPNGLATVANVTATGYGVPILVAKVDSTALSAAVAATALVSAPSSGHYRVEYTAKVTTAATTSSTLGVGTITGMVIGYTDATDSTVQSVTLPSWDGAGNVVTTTGVTTNTTTTIMHGGADIYAKTGVNITYAYGYSSSGATVMAYELHVKLLLID